MRSGLPHDVIYAGAGIDPIEQLLTEFSSRLNLDIGTLRREHQSLLIDLSMQGVALTPEIEATATRNLLAAIEKDINSGKLVLSSPKARNGFSRKQARKGGGRKQITGPSKLRTARDRARAEEWLKKKRRNA